MGLFGPLNFSVYLKSIHCPSPAPLLMAEAGPCKPCLLGSFANWLLAGFNQREALVRDESKMKGEVRAFLPIPVSLGGQGMAVAARMSPPELQLLLERLQRLLFVAPVTGNAISSLQGSSPRGGHGFLSG